MSAKAQVIWWGTAGMALLLALWLLGQAILPFIIGAGVAYLLDPLADRLELELPDAREFATAAGYVLSVLKHLPEEGEHFHDQGWRFEVVDLDGRRIDKVVAAQLPTLHRPGNRSAVA